MKNPIVITSFLDDLIDELNLVVYDLDIKNFSFTSEEITRSYSIEFAFDLCKKEVQKLLKDREFLYNLSESGDDYSDEVKDINQSLEQMDKLLVDLKIICDLEGTDYATPNHIASSVETLSEKLSEQLQAKILGEANYDEYYCKQLATVLEELCNIIKEA